jgi:predicted NACHT family NTPase
MESNTPVRGALGIGGKQPKTIYGHLASISQFNKFIEDARNKKSGIGSSKTFLNFEQWTADMFADEKVSIMFEDIEN